MPEKKLSKFIFLLKTFYPEFKTFKKVLNALQKKLKSTFVKSQFIKFKYDIWNIHICLLFSSKDFQKNKDDNIHKSEALERQDKRTSTLVECQN